MYTSLEALQSLVKKEEGTFDGIHVHSDDAFKDIEKRNFLEIKHQLLVGGNKMVISLLL